MGTGPDPLCGHPAGPRGATRVPGDAGRPGPQPGPSGLQACSWTSCNAPATRATWPSSRAWSSTTRSSTRRSRARSPPASSPSSLMTKVDKEGGTREPLAAPSWEGLGTGPADASGESGLTQLLMSEVMKLQKKAQDLTALLGSKDDLIKELRVKDGLLRKHQERAQRLKEACEAGGRELQRCKDENYDLALRLARQSEERGTALMRNRDLQLEIDRLKHSLMKAEDDCSVERKHTLKLRHAMEQRPSQELLWELQQEKALLQARVQGLEASVQEGRPDQSSPYIQVLEEDWRQAQRDLQEQTRTVFSLRKDLRQAEAQRARCLEEKEVFELQCLALRKDSKMYKDRIEAILRQMEEVAVERDQAIVTREELHAQQARSLQEKDVLRKQVRELSEKVDELQLQLFQREGQLLALEDRLRRQQLDTPVLSSDLEDSSPRSSQELSLPRDLEEDAQLSDRGGPAIEESLEQQKERLSLTPTDAGLGRGEPPEKEKGRRRLKESFENYRRKRALRKMQHGSRQGEVDWENTTGSDNTDTEGP
uniref:Caspase recruitment domain family member 9 n=1 Tax=Sus scrofa TaxID=9823 RepID=A0A8D0R9L1_PIG